MAIEATLASIGDRLRAARDRLGLTLHQLSERSGLSKAHLSRLESGERQPSIAALLELSSTLGVSVNALLGVLGTGACAHFDADRPHRLGAVDSPAEILMLAANDARSLHAIHR